MEKDLQYWVRDGNIWDVTNPPMLRPSLVAAALPVICDVNNWRVDEQMNDYSSDGGALTIDPMSCLNMPGFDLLPSVHGNWLDHDFSQFSGRAFNRSMSVLIQEEEEVNPKRYKLNQETTSAWSPNNFSGSISPTKESKIDDDFFGDRHPWNSPYIEPTCKGVLCNNTLVPSAAFLSSLQSVDDHSNFINSREEIRLLSSVVDERSRRKACHGDSLYVMDDEYLLRMARMETPSLLTTFKVRKEKLGDRVTALQQLVSPFGKTDTASVLTEGVQYIEFLHNQIRVLSCPYMKNHGILQQPQVCDPSECGPQIDLRSRGLCLVPISSTTTVDNYEIAANSTWAPPVSKNLNQKELQTN